MKKIIATTLSGLFIKTAPWKEAHRLWFERIVEQTGDESFRQWVAKTDYFDGVNLAMARIMPDASKEERVREARRMFMQQVLGYIKENRESVVNRDVAEFFRGIRQKYALALVTTNTRDFIDEILSAAGLSDFFDIIEASPSSEEDDKVAVFERFVEKNGKPAVYFGGERKDSYDFCRQKNIFCIFANLEGAKEMSVRTAHNLDEIKEIIQQIPEG